jgi:hypothetical protein
MQTTSHILMVRPVNFQFNAETATNNAFQTKSDHADIQRLALAEFEGLVDVLQRNGVEVLEVEDPGEPATPDSIFPNNWISFHEDGTICLYPMFAENRRRERRPDILQKIGREFSVQREIDFSHYEAQHLFLEGTGSMVLDRVHRIAYACLSPRTAESILREFGNRLGYRTLAFHAVDAQGLPIYHTNVMMCVADRYAVVCLDSVRDQRERQELAATIRNSGLDLIPISQDQMSRFAGNMLQVENRSGEKMLVMSAQALSSLSEGQRLDLEKYNRILHAPLEVIEANGGGSARCMMAELHLPLRSAPANPS